MKSCQQHLSTMFPQDGWPALEMDAKLIAKTLIQFSTAERESLFCLPDN